MEFLRTDLADELRSAAIKKKAKADKGQIDGVLYEEEKPVHGIGKTTIRVISEAGEKALGKPMGDYVTFSFPAISDFDVKAMKTLSERMADEIGALSAKLCPSLSSVLICGLGNRQITPDALGPLVCDKVLATHHIRVLDPALFEQTGFFDVSVLSPGVTAQTGLEAFDVLCGTVKRLRPDLIIAIDALCAREPERLARTVQLCTSGISPGAGIGNKRRGLTEKSIGVPVLGMGIPTVIDAVTFALDALGSTAPGEKEAYFKNRDSLFVSPKDMDKTARVLSQVLADALNGAFQKTLTPEEIALM